MATENFKFNLIEEFTGYNSCRDKTTIDPSFLIRGSKNVYFKRSGTVANRPGLKLRGAVDATEAGIKSSYEWQTNYGNLRPLRVTSDGRLQVEADVVTEGDFVWYDLETGLTKTRFVFDKWWDDDWQKERLLMVNGESSFRVWSGGITSLESVQTITSAVTSVAVNTAGSGYVVGDIITITAGDGLAQAIVTAIGGGGTVVLLGVVSNPGSGYVNAVNVGTSGGTGSGLTVDVTTGTRYSITKNGTNTWAEDGFDAPQIYNTSTFGVKFGNSSLTINGNTYSYTGGTDTTTIYGISSDPSAEPVNSVIIQPIRTFTDEPIAGFAMDFIAILNNQVIAGSYSSRIIYISADIDFTDFENAGAYITGDPDQVILDNLARGIGIKDGKAIIFGGDSDLYVVTLNEPVPISFTDPDGSTRYIITKVEKKVLSSNSSALAHEFIGNFSDDLLWLDQNNQLRDLGSFSQIFTIKPALLSLPVQEELSEDDFTDGALRIIDDTVYITAPVGGRDWMYQVREILSDLGEVTSQRIWHPPQIRNISRFALIEGIVYGHSNTYPQLYQVWDTGQWYDDSPVTGNEDGVPYGCNMKMAYRSSGERFLLKNFDKLAFEGYMQLGTNLNCYVYLEYQGSRDIQMVNVNSIDSPAKFYSGVSPFSLGDASLGGNPLGVGIVVEANEQDLLPKFRAICDINPKNCFEYSIELYSDQVDDRWEILTLGDNAKVASEFPVFLRKS